MFLAAAASTLSIEHGNYQGGRRNAGFIRIIERELSTFFSGFLRHDYLVTSCHGCCCGCKEFTIISVQPQAFGNGNSNAAGTTTSTEWACQEYAKNIDFIQIAQGDVALIFALRCVITMFSRHGVCGGCREYTFISIHPQGFGQGDSNGTGATSNTGWECQADERNVGCILIVERELPVFLLLFAARFSC